MKLRGLCWHCGNHYSGSSCGCWSMKKEDKLDKY